MGKDDGLAAILLGLGALAAAAALAAHIANKNAERVDTFVTCPSCGALVTLRLHPTQQSAYAVCPKCGRWSSFNRG